MNRFSRQLFQEKSLSVRFRSNGPQTPLRFGSGVFYSQNFLSTINMACVPISAPFPPSSFSVLAKSSSANFVPAIDVRK